MQQSASTRSGGPLSLQSNSRASLNHGVRQVTRVVRQRQLHSGTTWRHRNSHGGVVVHAEEDGNKETLGNLDAILSSSQDEEQPAAQEQPKTEDDGFFERQAMSEAQKAKLRDEYLSFGGSANTAMGGNYYLYIIVAISAMAVAAKLSGALD